MSAEVQTSIEQLNLMAAQLRYKIDSNLQLNVNHRHQLQIVKEDPHEVIEGEMHFDPKYFPGDSVSAVAALENDFLHREVIDLKQTIDKLALQLRAKDTTLKSYRDELKQEKANSETMKREQRQISADAKANERYVKCVQLEFELLRNMTTKSQEAFALVGIEGMRVATEFDKSSKMVKKQMKEIGEKNAEVKSLQEEVQRLHADIVVQRATSGVSSNSLKKSILEVERLLEKEKRSDSRIFSLTERVDKERHLNKGLLIAIEESAIKAETAFEGVQAAASNQTDLVNRLNEVNNEVSNLKYVLNEQQSQAAAAAKNAMVSIHTAVVTSNNDNCSNNNGKISTINSSMGTRHDEGDKQATNQGIEDGFSQSQDDIEGSMTALIDGYSVNDNNVKEKENMSQKEANDSSEVLKRKRQEEWDTIKIQKTQQTKLQEDTTVCDLSLSSKEYIPTTKATCISGDEPVISSSRPHASILKENTVKQEELDTDDERCQICLDSPYGLMVLCSICKRALHSACAKRIASAGNMASTGKTFKCPQC